MKISISKVMNVGNYVGVLVFLFVKVFLSSRVKAFGLSKFSLFSKLRASGDGRILLGNGARLLPFSRVEARGKLVIGERLTLNRYSRIIALDSIYIGDNVTVAEFVSILDHDHRFFLEGSSTDTHKLALKGYNTGPTVVGSNVWIGDKVTICRGVKIGSNSVIGANSVVISDVPENSVAAGVPARVVRRIT